MRLTQAEYDFVVKRLGRSSNDLELAMLEAMYSEHCSYKSSRKILKMLPTQSQDVLQGPGENAGIVDIGNGFAVAFKIESHNHPSFIEPFQGAATGVGGIVRDILAMGARPIALLDALRFGSIQNRRMPYLVKGVISGIGAYGNAIGVPTVGGETIFDDAYAKNILVNVFCLGILKKDRIFRGIAKEAGFAVLYAGALTGRDGIDGATMASKGFDGNKTASRQTVQIGDPFFGKLLIEACLAAMEQDLISGIQDMGAAGITSTAFEMAHRGGLGMDIHLDDVPLREPGMTPIEIALSESQERMLLVVCPEHVSFVIDLFQKGSLACVQIGTVTNVPHLRLFYAGNILADLPVSLATSDVPLCDRPKYPPKLDSHSVNPPPLEKRALERDFPMPPLKICLNDVLLRVLASPNMASKAWIYRQYDYGVQTNTVVLPGLDSAVLRIKSETYGALETRLALTLDAPPSWLSRISPRLSGIFAVAEAARNLACSGAKPIGVTDGLNFGNPEDPTVMWQFEGVVSGIALACQAFHVPVVSGNVSFYNETDGQSIPPTPMIAMVGVIKEAILTSAFKRAGDKIFLLNGPLQNRRFGYAWLDGILDSGLCVPDDIPEVTLDREIRLSEFLLTYAPYLHSAHDVSQGGLAVTLVESCLTGSSPIGASIETVFDLDTDIWLFGETPGAVIVSLEPRYCHLITHACNIMNISYQHLGTVGGNRLKIADDLDLALSDIEKVWQGIEGQDIAPRYMSVMGDE